MLNKTLRGLAMSCKEWKECKLGNVIEVNPLRSLTKSSFAKKVPMDALNVNDRNISYYEETTFKGSGTKFKNGDTLLARITPCLENGKTAFVSCLKDNEIAFGSTEYIVLSEKKGISDSLFIYYLAREPQFRSYAIGHMEGSSGRQRVPATSVANYEINFPPLSEQQAIAKILGSLDDKIELNRQMNKTLEETAQAIFKSWFVDFDPVKAKAEGRTIEGLSQEIMDLFPDGFEESELGEIPREWKVATLGDVTSYLSRGISPKYIEEGGVLVINQRCIRDNRVSFANARRHDTSKRSIDGRLLELGDVVVNSTGVGTLGRVAQIEYLEENSIVDSHVTIVRADENIMKKTVLGFELIIRQAEIEALGEGSTGQTELSRQRLGELSLIVPNKAVQDEFVQIVMPIKEKIVANEKENLVLIKLRDSLLPQLISGQIRVGKAEKVTEGVV